MTDPQLPPPYGSVPPAPPAPYGSMPPVPAAPGYTGAPPVPLAPEASGVPAVPLAPGLGHEAPPGAYQVPVGGYQAPMGGYPSSAGGFDVTPPVQPSNKLGVFALIFSLVAAVVTPIVGAFGAYQIGVRVPSFEIQSSDPESLKVLSPARDQVLFTEITFWTGTVLGIAAIVMGIIAIARRRGRGQGIAGLIIAVVAPGIFFLVLSIALAVGAGAGALSYYG